MPPRRERAKITDRIDVHARETDALVRLEAAKHPARAGAGRAGRTGRTPRSSNPGHPPVAWWQTDDFWQYALFAAVAYIRAAASRAGAPVRQACQDLAQRPATRRHNDPFGAAPTPSRRYGLAAHSGSARVLAGLLSHSW
jgi:hypothetical protein